MCCIFFIQESEYSCEHVQMLKTYKNVIDLNKIMTLSSCSSAFHKVVVTSLKIHFATFWKCSHDWKKEQFWKKVTMYEREDKVVKSFGKWCKWGKSYDNLSVFFFFQKKEHLRNVFNLRTFIEISSKAVTLKSVFNWLYRLIVLDLGWWSSKV